LNPFDTLRALNLEAKKARLISALLACHDSPLFMNSAS